MHTEPGAVDAHTHIEPRWFGMAARVMDRCGVECSVNAGWMDAHGEKLGRLLEAARDFPGRFVQLANLDWSGIGGAGWGEREADSLERAAGRGAGGLKIFKDLGLGVRDSRGELLRVDDRLLDPVFERAAALGLPVLIHTADPWWFWRPPDERNFWRGVLAGGHEDWSYYRRGMPSREELLGERDSLVARHPDTVFISPHLASLADDPLAFAETLEALPNLHADISARLPSMTRTEQRARLWRELLIRFQDRVLFGTDLIYTDSDVAVGIQSQSFQRPGDLDIPVSRASEQTYEDTSVSYTLSHFAFLRSAGLQPAAPFRRSAGSTALRGLGLPPEALEKILRLNAEKVYGGRVR